MRDILFFTIGRYAGFFSHVAAFLAGLSLILPVVYAMIPLAFAVVLGSLSAWCNKQWRQ